MCEAVNTSNIFVEFAANNDFPFPVFDENSRHCNKYAKIYERQSSFIQHSIQTAGGASCFPCCGSYLHVRSSSGQGNAFSSLSASSTSRKSKKSTVEEVLFIQRAPSCLECRKNQQNLCCGQSPIFTRVCGVHCVLFSYSVHPKEKKPA